MFQKSKLHNKANIHTFSAVSGSFFQGVMTSDTHRQKQNAYLGDQMQKDRCIENMSCLPNPNYSEEGNKQGRAHCCTTV